MAFYAHPFARHFAPQQSPAPTFNIFGPPPHHPHGPRGHHGPQGFHGHPFGRPRHHRHHDDFELEDDIDAEERAALAHLRAIRQRREAAAQREAAIRQEAAEAVRREAAIQSAAERQLARESAIRAHVQRQIEAEHARRQALASAIAQEQHRAAIQQARAERRAEIEAFKRREACARRCVGGCRKEVKEKENDGEDWKEFEQALTRFFGFVALSSEDAAPASQQPKAEATKPAEKLEEKTKENKGSVETAPAAVKPAPSTASTAKDATAPADETREVPANLNELINHFLGFSLAPATAEDKPTGNAEDMTKNLNTFLGQFGLEFEPVQNGESSASAPASSSAAPAAETAKETSPIAAFLNGSADIPPFVRDILSNVDQVFSGKSDPAPESEPVVEGKGKGVAAGEKPSAPTPAPASAPAPEPVAAASATPAESADTTSSTDSIAKLRDISHELDLVVRSFTFPDHLSFAPSTEEPTPALLFNKANSGYHAQAHKLLQLLLAADGISSGGDRAVRKERKALVKSVEGAIEDLEQRRDEAWKEVREKRERGEESEDEGSVTSWSSRSSVAGEVEHLENVDTTNDVEKPETAETADNSTPADSADAAQQSQSADPQTIEEENKFYPAAAAEPEAKGFDLAPPKVEDKEDKDEGFELL